ncbi:NAD-dependent epimerase/dehydratase family protein [Pyrobaculum aerophilum]|uniref:NAD dependent epimerase/dehydratase, putative n=2 Tax=Pyrobaculum aerophilum TaxID=13773 RepID=Q8ZSQ5_PYRAE|nr:NAD(P)-dependent oxidoreductase [Pyrobaculum aerophilum]AAL65058.1 NAD dependent epimerase/dehydratase, putative [Pyrobaculum aerophilum str. IM2]MCX8137655.1 NAD(P)-dependent oxidoreductase [Pyrobaculum aerophilum]RFA95474.1 NAD(P)-dependent oxidoreductase [Pyrobaculum aerophilum]RFA97664.1 NAD(P)-dependent oxidoreductase [Pyrobaculum aerophilum]HII47813.1 NAD(P)-dependent oxidoreductase [Pyrobaculum aerophilum]
MRILIYGGLGFIGANVVEALAGNELYVAHRPGSPGRKPKIASFVSQYAGLVEYTDPARPLEAVKPELIINLVGEYFGPPEVIKSANADFPKRLCEASRRAGWRGKVIHISAATVRGPVGEVIREEERHLEGISPVSYFDETKAEGERAVAQCFEDWVIVRPVLVYGRFNDHPEWVMLVNYLQKGFAPAIRARVSVISARELAKVIKASMALSREYFFATECLPRMLVDFIDAMARAVRKRVVKIPVPTSLLKLAAPRELRSHIPFLNKTFSCEKLKKLLGFTPAPDFEKEIMEMTNFILNIH